MSTLDITRAWKDPEHRQGLGETERAVLLPHQSRFIGAPIELTEGEIDAVAGGGVIGAFFEWVSKKLGDGSKEDDSAAEGAVLGATVGAVACGPACAVGGAVVGSILLGGERSAH